MIQFLSLNGMYAVNYYSSFALATAKDALLSNHLTGGRLEYERRL